MNKLQCLHPSAPTSVTQNPKEDISTHMLAAAGVMPKTPEVLRKPACAAAHALGILGGWWLPGVI